MRAIINNPPRHGCPTVGHSPPGTGAMQPTLQGQTLTCIHCPTQPVLSPCWSCPQELSGSTSLGPQCHRDWVLYALAPRQDRSGSGPVCPEYLVPGSHHTATQRVLYYIRNKTILLGTSLYKPYCSEVHLLNQHYLQIWPAVPWPGHKPIHLNSPLQRFQQPP